MKNKLLVLSMVSVFALAGCHGTKKVEFSKFAEKVAELKIEEEGLKEIKIKGKVGDEKYKFSVDLSSEEAMMKSAMDLSVKELAVFEEVEMFGSVQMFAEKEIEGAKYYVGSGYKVVVDNEDEKCKFEYNKKGFLTLIKGEMNKEAVNLSVTVK